MRASQSRVTVLVLCCVLSGSGYADQTASTGLKGSYTRNGRIHVGVFGEPDGPPITTGPADMKPSWSKTGDVLVFFRVTRFAATIPDWKTAICMVNADGTGFRMLTDGTHTDFNPTWTRDGSNLVVFNRRNPDEENGYAVMMTGPGSKPGEEQTVSGQGYFFTYAFSCLKDGRMFVGASREPADEGGLPANGGYFLMTPGRKGQAKYELIECDLAQKGMLDRVSISPDEKKICFELQQGWGEYRYPGRALYIADFDARQPAVTNPKAIANETFDPNVTCLYPRWTRDQSAVVYHGNKTGRNQLYMFRLADRSTTRISTDPEADYAFAHGEATPKIDVLGG